MPRYDIQHVIPLTDAQKGELARAITKLHCERFQVPSLFVNVLYTDISQWTAFIGGKETKANHIMAHVRLGQRVSEDFQQLCGTIEAAWDRIVSQPHASDGTIAQWKLTSVAILPLDIIGREAGLDIPLAGQEADWIKNNFPEMQRRAEEGDENMVNLVNEIKSKGLL